MSNKKTRKAANVRSSILILLLIAILLIASTYAWFTANKTVTISTLNVSVQASSGLQISADGSSWKAVLSNSDIDPTNLASKYASNLNQIPEELKPVSTAGNLNDGLMDMFLGTVEADGNPDHTATYGQYVLTTTAQTDTSGTSGNYVAFDIFLRVDKDTDIVLTKASDVTDANPNDDRGLKNATRVAFIMAADSDVKASGAELSAIQGVKPSVLKIWEPNCNVHTAAAVSHGISNYGYTTENLTTSTIIPSYKGVQAATTEALLLNSNDATVFNTVTPTIQTNAAYGTAEGAKDTDFYSLKTGITKMRIYLWVEGQDIDCENTASGANLKFDIQFAVKEDTTP